MAKTGWTWKSLSFWRLCMALIFITSGLFMNAVQFLIYIGIRPWDPILYRRVAYYFSYMINSQIVFLVEWWSGSQVTLWTDEETLSHLGTESALLLPNHGCEIDWLCGWTICERVGCLGNTRIYAKKMLQYVPVLGWQWKMQENIFLARDWDKDKRVLENQLNCLAQYPSPVWLCLFPEGTRFSKEKHAASMEIALKKGMAPLKHHLLPRTKGFTASVAVLQGKFPAVYDFIVAVDKDCENEATLLNLLEGKRMKVTLFLRRVEIKNIPTEEKEAALWLQRLFQEKDKLLDNHIQCGEFVPPSERNKEEYAEYKNFKICHLPRRPFTLLTGIFWSLFILYLFGSFLWNRMLYGSTFEIVGIIVAAIAANAGFKFVIDLSLISKGSSYGKKQS